MVESPKMVFAELLPRTVIKEDRFSSVKLNATNANHAHLDKLTILPLTVVLLQSLDQPVIATNNSTNKPTNARTAQLVNFQVMVELHKTVFAEPQHRTVIKEDRFSSVKPNAINANHAQLDKISLVTFAINQDQPVIATNNSTKPLTNVRTAQPVNSQVMVEQPKMVFAEQLLRTVMLKVRSNWVKCNASDARAVESDKPL
jgi:hypothetical protein